MPPPAACSATILAGALEWHQFGLNVIPIFSSSKHPAVTWDAWLTSLCAETIKKYWGLHADHELGFIVGEDLIVFDADSQQSIAALEAAEQSFAVKPALAVQTRKGLHHYFRLAQGTFAKSDSHSTHRHPERIDVKTGRAMVVLPPSPGKAVIACLVAHASELTEVSQEFVDAIFTHNGRTPPRRLEPAPPRSRKEPGTPNQPFALLRSKVFQFDPDSGYDDWLRVGAIIFNETGGDDDGFELFDEWSAEGKKYGGRKETAAKWKSFNPDHPNPATIKTLIHMIRAQGGDLTAACTATDESFDFIDDPVEEAA